MTQHLIVRGPDWWLAVEDSPDLPGAVAQLVLADDDATLTVALDRHQADDLAGWLRGCAAPEVDGSGYARRPDPAAPAAVPGRTRTSQLAAERVLPRSGTQRALILRLMQEVDYLTDEQLSARTGLSPNTVRPRRGELVAMGWVTDSGQTRPTRSGHQATVWRYVTATEHRRRLEGQLPLEGD